MNPSLESILLALKPRPVPEGTPISDSTEGHYNWPSEHVPNGEVPIKTARQLERRAIIAESLALTDDVRDAVAGCVEALGLSEIALGIPTCDANFWRARVVPFIQARDAALARLARALGVREEGK